MTPRNKEATPWIIAHRGAMTEAPENTKAAFDAALVYPIDGLELDVQLSSDDAIVVFHDGDLTRISGSRKRISEHSFEELTQMDWGKWHDNEFAGQTIMTLEDVLIQYGEKTRLMVEIKSYDPDRRSGKSYQLTMQVLDTLNRLVAAEHRSKIFILSFDRDVLRCASESDIAWQYVLNIEEPSSILDDDHNFPEYLHGYGAPIGKLTSAFVDYVHRRGQRSMTWSCNTRKHVESALTAGADVIMTDRPRWIVDYLRGRGAPK